MSANLDNLKIDFPMLQKLDVVNLEDKRLGEQEIREMALIYRKQTSRPLSNYQKRMKMLHRKSV